MLGLLHTEPMQSLQQPIPQKRLGCSGNVWVQVSQGRAAALPPSILLDHSFLNLSS